MNDSYTRFGQIASSFDRCHNLSFISSAYQKIPFFRVTDLRTIEFACIMTTISFLTNPRYCNYTSVAMAKRLIPSLSLHSRSALLPLRKNCNVFSQSPSFRMEARLFLWALRGITYRFCNHSLVFQQFHKL